jgi:hypothetical protein
MKRPQLVVGAIALVLMLGAAGVLAKLKAGHQLGPPGVKTQPIPGSGRLEILLPELVVGYESKAIEQDAEVLKALPQDTSFGQRRYTAGDGFEVSLNVVMMGTDRTSIHKPQFCLTGAGWRIDQTTTERVRVYRPQPYDLPVVKITASREVSVGGQTMTLRGVYVYWFVCDGAISGEPSGAERMWWMARELLRTGVLQRWAYVTCFSVCAPGQEEETYKRVERFIAFAVPDFQLVPKPQSEASAAAAGR